MKIEKGMTLGQFVDMLSASMAPSGYVQFELVADYNNRLREPLTKDMFVNPHEKPLLSDYVKSKDVHYDDQYMEYKQAINQWQEAEKKVIFKIDHESHPKLNAVAIGDYYVTFPTGCVRLHKFGTEKHWDCKILGDIFDATNGKLKLKNFEI